MTLKPVMMLYAIIVIPFQGREMAIPPLPSTTSYWFSIAAGEFSNQ